VCRPQSRSGHRSEAEESPCREPNLGRPARSLVSMLTELRGS